MATPNQNQIDAAVNITQTLLRYRGTWERADIGHISQAVDTVYCALFAARQNWNQADFQIVYDATTELLKRRGPLED